MSRPSPSSLVTTPSNATAPSDQRNEYSRSNTASEAVAIQRSLLRTHELLRSSAERVSHVASAIADDGKLLDETLKNQQTMNISKAKKTLTALERAQQMEQRILMISVVFFWTVVFYVLWCRIILHIPFIDRILGLISFR